MSRGRRIRDAVEAYRRGHDRVWPNDRMRALPSPAPDDEPEFTPPPSPPRFGIPVARTLDFQRGPDTWRIREQRGGSRATDD